MPATSFTRHAWARVIDRLSLAPPEVAALLDYELAVPIGSRGGTRHRLFYSAPDRQCFVAVQDEQNGAAVYVELYRLSLAAFGRFVSRIPSPRGIASSST